MLNFYSNLGTYVHTLQWGCKFAPGCKFATGCKLVANLHPGAGVQIAHMNTAVELVYLD